MLLDQLSLAPIIMANSWGCWGLKAQHLEGATLATPELLLKAANLPQHGALHILWTTTPMSPRGTTLGKSDLKVCLQLPRQKCNRINCTIHPYTDRHFISG